MTRKPLWKPSSSPGPGMYEVTKADKLTKFNNSTHKITTPLRLYKKHRETTPDAGFYQKVDESFCKNSQNITSLIKPLARYFPKFQSSYNVMYRNNSPLTSQFQSLDCSRRHERRE